MTSSAPLLRVVTGDPTPEELAVVVAVLSAAGSAAPSAGGAAGFSRWADRSALVRSSLPTGAGAWRVSARTR